MLARGARRTLPHWPPVCRPSPPALPWLRRRRMATAADEQATTLASLAEFIASDSCRSVVVLTGAGMSVAAGIPDFRSPGGMYATLRPELLTATPQQQCAPAATLPAPGTPALLLLLCRNGSGVPAGR